MAEFQIECFQNEFLPQGGAGDACRRHRHARRGPAAASGPRQADERTELLIVDTSGSMNGKKLRAAKAATAAAIDCIPDGVRFGVITGNHEATLGGRAGRRVPGVAGSRARRR